MSAELYSNHVWLWYHCWLFVVLLLFQVQNGHIKRITDNDIQSLVIEIVGTNVSTTFITCPEEPKKVLGIKLPFLVMIIKNLKKYFTFEVQVLDDKNVKRRFRASNYQSTTRVKPFICTMPMRLDDGWNQIQVNTASCCQTLRSLLNKTQLGHYFKECYRIGKKLKIMKITDLHKTYTV